jgi:hypothetical protein
MSGGRGRTGVRAREPGLLLTGLDDLLKQLSKTVPETAPGDDRVPGPACSGRTSPLSSRPPASLRSSPGRHGRGSRGRAPVSRG